MHTTRSTHITYHSKATNQNTELQKTVASHLKRIEFSLLIAVFDCEVKAKNISSSGVYFEVIPKDVSNYLLGKEITAQRFC